MEHGIRVTFISERMILSSFESGWIRIEIYYFDGTICFSTVWSSDPKWSSGLDIRREIFYNVRSFRSKWDHPLGMDMIEHLRRSSCSNDRKQIFRSIIIQSDNSIPNYGWNGFFFSVSQSFRFIRLAFIFRIWFWILNNKPAMQKANSCNDRYIRIYNSFQVSTNRSKPRLSFQRTSINVI